MRGSLGLFSLLDLLQLLGSNQSRGYLAIHHPNRGEARVYLDQGRVVHIAFDGLTDLEALRAVLRDERGNFEFLPNRAAPAVTIQASLDNLLLAAIRGMEPNGRGEDREAPPPEELDIPVLTDLERVGRLTLSAEEMPVIERIDGVLSVAGIAAATDRPIEVVQRTLQRLSSLQLLEVRRRSPRIARLVVALGRDLTDMTAGLDEVILRAWSRQQGHAVEYIRIRQESGRELVFPVRGGPRLGPNLAFSNVALMRFSLRAGESILARPEV
ncbi:MAG TPA: DUF4388 domain-containing protein [Deinococcales bacterium]|nr:DUF4388 domain-containing protein [Deinococcales bacterium]